MVTTDELKNNIENITNAVFSINNNIGVYHNHTINGNSVIVELIRNGQIDGSIEIPLEFAKGGYESLNSDADNGYVILRSISKTLKYKF